MKQNICFRCTKDFCTDILFSLHLAGADPGFGQGGGPRC